MTADRIQRLCNALGPCAFGFDLADHLRRVLLAMGDERAARLVTRPPQRKRAA